MKIMEVTHSELVFGHTTNLSSQNEKTIIFDELLKNSQNDLLDNPNIKDIIEKRSDETNIFEHYADITSQNYQFIIGNLDKLSEQINNFIIQLKEGKLNIDQKEIFNYFEGMFAAFDKKYGSHLKTAFQDAFKQLSSIREYKTNGDLLKDTLNLMKNIHELSDSIIPSNNKLVISKFFEQITNSDDKNLSKDSRTNVNYPELIKDTSEIDKNRILNKIELKNNPIRENIATNITQTNQNYENKDTSINHKLEIINMENDLENFGQNENNFNHNSNFNNFLSSNNPILNNSLPNNISHQNNRIFSEIFEQGIANYTFKNIKVEDFGKTVGGFIRNLHGENQATAKLILEPQWLGTVIVDVLMKNDVAEIKIKARSKEAVEAIEKQINVLKEKLFMVLNLDKLSEQINNFIIQLKEGKLNIDQKEIFNYFEGMFAAFDKKYGSHLKTAFQDAFKQLSSIREYKTNGDLLKDTLNLMKNIHELSDSIIPSNNKLVISKFFEQITNSDDKNLSKDSRTNVNYPELIKDTSEIDKNRILNKIELKNNPIRENIATNITQTNQNYENKDTSINHKLEIINMENDLENFGQNENNFNHNSNFNNFLSSNNPILNNSLPNNISHQNNRIFSEIFEQGIANYTFKNIKVEDFGKTVGGFIRNLHGENQATAKLILEPQWLGTVIVDVLMKNDVAEIKIKARSKEAVEAIEKQINVLKEKLSENGITTGKIDISNENQEETDLANNNEQQKNKKDEREFLNSFIRTENYNEIIQDEANDSFRLWMQKLIEKYV